MQGVQGWPISAISCVLVIYGSRWGRKDDQKEYQLASPVCSGCRAGPVCRHFLETYQDDITSRKWKLQVTCWSFVMYTTIIVLTGCFAPSRSTTSKQPFLTVRPDNRSRRLACHPVHCPVHRPKTWSHPSHCNLTWHQLGTSSSRLKSTTWKKCDSTRLENKLTYSWLQTDLDKSWKLGLQCKLRSCYS